MVVQGAGDLGDVLLYGSERIEYDRCSIRVPSNFFKRRKKLCLILLIKKKRVAWLINGKLAKTVINR